VGRRLPCVLEDEARSKNLWRAGAPDRKDRKGEEPELTVNWSIGREDKAESKSQSHA
jgi:hypothetical protein